MKKERVAFLLFLFLLLCASADQYIMIPNFNVIMKELKLNETQIGLISSAFLFISSVVMILWGYLSDRVPRKLLVVIGSLIWSVASLLTFFTPSIPGKATFYYLFIIRMITGFGVGSIVPIGFSVMGDLFPPKERGRAFTFFGVARGIGGAFGMGMAALLPGWRLPFLVLAIPSILAILLFYFYIPEAKRAEKEPELEKLIAQGIEYSYKIKKKDIIAMFKSRPTLFLLLQGIPGTIPFTIFTYWFPTYLQREFQFEKFASTIALIGFAFLGMVGYIVGGNLSDFFTRKNFLKGRVWLALIAVLLPIPFYIIGLNIPLASDFGAGRTAISDIIFKIVLHPSFLIVTLFLGIAYFVQNLIGANFYACVADVNLPERRGTAISVMNVADAGGAGIAPLIGGLLAMHLNNDLRLSILLGLSFWIFCATFWLPMFKYLPAGIEEVKTKLAERAQEMQ